MNVVDGGRPRAQLPDVQARRRPHATSNGLSLPQAPCAADRACLLAMPSGGPQLPADGARHHPALDRAGGEERLIDRPARRQHRGGASTAPSCSTSAASGYEVDRPARGPWAAPRPTPRARSRSSSTPTCARTRSCSSASPRATSAPRSASSSASPTSGPKIALNILGSLSVGELAAAVARGETSKLTKVPGVGKKTAERIVLELKDKLLAHAPPAMLTPSPAAGRRRAAPRPSCSTAR